MAANLSAGRNVWAFCTAVLAAALLLCYWPTLTGTIYVLTHTGDSARALLPVVVGAYAIWTGRNQWKALTLVPDGRGLVLITLGLLIAVGGAAGDSLTLPRVGFVCSLAGCIVAAGGFGALRLLAFPLGVLAFLFPVPGPLFHALAGPLQDVASRGAEVILHLFGFNAIRAGNEIRMTSHIVVVSEACSGVQSLITLAFFCFVYAYWNDRSNVARALLVGAALPALAVSNIVRVAATGMIGEFDLQYARGSWHEALGYLTLTMAFLAIWACHNLLRGMHREAVPVP